MLHICGYHITHVHYMYAARTHIHVCSSYTHTCLHTYMYTHIHVYTCTSWAYAAFGKGGVKILYQVTLRHAKLWITQFGRFNKRGGGGGAVAVRMK